jgi:pyruvate kinase
MLSEETAIGRYPVETVAMMASIAISAEGQEYARAITQEELRWYLKNLAEQGKLTVPDVISRNSVVAADVLRARYIITPTDTGGTATRVARYKPGCWVLAFSRHEATTRYLMLSYGVYPIVLESGLQEYQTAIMTLLKREQMVKDNDKVILVKGRVADQPGGTDSLEIMTVA